MTLPPGSCRRIRPFDGKGICDRSRFVRPIVDMGNSHRGNLSSLSSFAAICFIRMRNFSLDGSDFQRKGENTARDTTDKDENTPVRLYCMRIMSIGDRGERERKCENGR